MRNTTLTQEEYMLLCDQYREDPIIQHLLIQIQNIYVCRIIPRVIIRSGVAEFSPILSNNNQKRISELQEMLQTIIAKKYSELFPKEESDV
jgi:hypothetical protein